jgi:uncharacterized protein
LSLKEVFFESQGIKLCGVLNKSKGEQAGNVLLVHGIISDKDEDGNYIKLAKQLSLKGYNVFRFDFRGHGESEGESQNVTIAGELSDLENAIREFSKLVGKIDRLIIIAQSFGAVSSILYADDHQSQIEKLVLWNPVLDLEKTFVKAETPWGKTFFNEKGYRELAQNGYISVPDTDFRFGRELINEFEKIKPYKLLSTFKMPILTIHGTEDTSVPYSVAEKYGAPNECSKFIPHKCEHTFVGIANIVIDETVEWVTQKNVCKKKEE